MFVSLVQGPLPRLVLVGMLVLALQQTLFVDVRPWGVIDPGPARPRRRRRRRRRSAEGRACRLRASVCSYDLRVGTPLGSSSFRWASGVHRRLRRTRSRSTRSGGCGAVRRPRGGGRRDARAGGRVRSSARLGTWSTHAGNCRRRRHAAAMVPARCSSRSPAGASGCRRRTGQGQGPSDRRETGLIGGSPAAAVATARRSQRPRPDARRSNHAGSPSRAC